MLWLFALICPVGLPWMPDLTLVNGNELRLVLSEGAPRARPDVLYLEALVIDGAGRVMMDSTDRGLDLMLRPGDAGVDGVLQRCVGGLGVGGSAVLLSSCEQSYPRSSGLLPASGPLILSVNVVGTRSLQSSTAPRPKPAKPKAPTRRH